MELFKATFVNSHTYSTLFRPFGMFEGAFHNLYNRAYGNNVSMNETFKSIKKNESTELLKYMWNQGESGIGYGAISLTLINSKISVVEWIKINSIECLVLSNNPLPFMIPQNKMFNSKNKIAINNDLNDVNIILHMHGGGFVAGSPHTHQNYLRKWAQDTNAIIISINYSRLLDVKYPVTLNECYHIYKLLVKGNLFGFKPNKIILIGDSAGGNLALTMSIKAITNNLEDSRWIVISISCC